MSYCNFHTAEGLSINHHHFSTKPIIPAFQYSNIPVLGELNEVLNENGQNWKPTAGNPSYYMVWITISRGQKALCVTMSVNSSLLETKIQDLPHLSDLF